MGQGPLGQGKEGKTFVPDQSAHPPEALSGMWAPGVTWRYHTSQDVPDRSLIVGVACLGATRDEIVLTKNQRGVWEPLGGHLEPGEDAESALRREALEEGGLRLSAFAQFGFLEVSNSVSELNPSTGIPYPPTTFLPLYAGVSDRPLTEPTGQEVVATLRLSLHDQDSWQALPISRSPTGWFGRPALLALLAGELGITVTR